MAKARPRTGGGTGGQAAAPPPRAPGAPARPQATPGSPGQAQAAPGSAGRSSGVPGGGTSRPLAESGLDPIALLAAGLVLAAIALAAWFGLFRAH
ncbi:MAG TPA: hypothetical protein VKC58_11145 [Myxococcales bacterium]|nr:hypothetical protein [Myxococcales bacterium]